MKLTYSQTQSRAGQTISIQDLEEGETLVHCNTANFREVYWENRNGMLWRRNSVSGVWSSQDLVAVARKHNFYPRKGVVL